MNAKIEKIYKIEIFHRISIILSKTLKSSFLILKASYYSSSPSVDSHEKLENMLEIIHNITIRNKRYLFSQIANIKQSEGYWRSKAIVILIGIANRKCRTVQSYAMRRMKMNVAQYWNRMQQILKLDLAIMNKTIEDLRYRRLKHSFTKISNARAIAIHHKRQAMNLKVILGRLILKQYNYSFKKVLECRGMSHQNQEHDSPQIVVESIKTIIISLTKSCNIQVPNSSKSRKESQEKGMQMLWRTIQEKQWGNLRKSFNWIVWGHLQQFDEEMVNNLQTQIEILRSQFDSL